MGAFGIRLHAHMLQARTGGHVHMAQAVGQVGMLAGGDVVFDDGRFRTAPQFDEVAQVPGLVGCGGCAHEHQVQGLGQARVLRQPQHRALIGKGGVEAGERFVGARVAALHEVGGAWVGVCQRIRQRHQGNGGGQA